MSRPEPPPAQRPDPQAQRDPVAQPDPAAPRDLAPREAPSAPALSSRTRSASAVRYEKGLAVKALLAIALVAAMLVFRVFFFG